MIKTSENNSNEDLVEVIVNGIKEKKGLKISIVNLSKITDAYADYFIICTASSETNAQAIARSIEDLTLTLLKEKPIHIEGYQQANWILLDYFNIMVHIFKEDQRGNFDLEHVWADAQIDYITDNEDQINEQEEIENK